MQAKVTLLQQQPAVYEKKNVGYNLETKQP